MKGADVEKILIVEDSVVQAFQLKDILDEEYDVTVVNTGEDGLCRASAGNFSLILLDVVMPGMDGFMLLKKLQNEVITQHLPVILITSLADTEHEQLGLTLGAVDYITKPFNPIEVLARVRSQLRRYTTLGGMEQKPSKLVTGGIVMDDEAKTVTVDGDPVSLTPIEYNILHLLMSHPGRVYSSAQIYEQVWNESAFGSEGAVAVHIRHLREKLEIDPSNPRYLKVVWGLGYKMEP